MSKVFLGKGWDFPVQPDPVGGIALAAYEDSIRQSIWLILGTSPGERVMRPDFGCGLYDLVFSPASAETSSRANGMVREALLRWEPRIDVLNISTTNDPQEPNKLLIMIDYRIRATNSRFNLVYPFYVET
jgi:hypothetical protein